MDRKVTFCGIALSLKLRDRPTLREHRKSVVRHPMQTWTIARSELAGLYFCFMHPAPPAVHFIGLLVPVTLPGGGGL